MAGPQGPLDDGAHASDAASAEVPAQRSAATLLERLGLAGPDRRLLRAAAALVGVGVLLRIAAPFFMDLWMDGDTYAAMGHAFTRHGDFLLPWGDVTTWACAGPTYSHHYPPMYPLYLAGIYKLAGFGLWQTKMAAVLVALAALAVAGACTADLYGRRSAWLVTGILAVERGLVWATGTGFTENLVILLFTATLWAVLKGLKDERYVLLAGLLAGLAYLTRAGMGAFFIVAGVGGLAWRLHYMGWAVLRSKWYLGAVAIFGALVAAWAARNLAHFGWPHWETSAYTTFVQGHVVDHLGTFAQGLVGKLPLFLLFLAIYLVPFATEARRSLRNVGREDESALWLAVVLVAFIGWVLASMYWTYEQWGGLWWLDNHRYIVIAYVPILWMVARHRKPGDRRFALRYGILACGLLLASLYTFAEPTQSPASDAAAELAPLLFHNAEVGIEGQGGNLRYALYPHLGRSDLFVYGCVATATDPCPGQDPDYILSLYPPGPHPGYRLVDTHTVRYALGPHAFDGIPVVGPTLSGLFGNEDWTAYTYERDGPGPLGPLRLGCNLAR